MPHRTSMNEFSSGHQAIGAAATRLEQILKQSLALRGKASLGVCGGRTASALFPVLSQCHLDWANVHIFLVDERWVPIDDDDSNERLVRRLLLQGPAAAARFYGLKTRHASAKNALDEVEQRLVDLGVPFDVVFLGMGDDGHIASLFPGGRENEERIRLVAASTAPVQPVERISLSPGALAQARHIILPVIGATKRAVLDKALTPGPVSMFPVRHVLTGQSASCELFLAL
jgi:6-phosphogluconolactonase